MFKSYGVYTHRNMIDTNVLVLKSYRLHDGRYRIKIRWLLKNGMDIGLQETITISRPQVKNWREVSSF